MYGPGGGGEGGSGSMKRTPTAEEREREAKVCGISGVWDLSGTWGEGQGNRRDVAGGRSDAWSEAKAKGLVSKGTIHIGCWLYIPAGLVLLDQLANGRHPWTCSAPTSSGKSVASLVPQFTGLSDDCDGTRCAFLFGNHF